jgi:hypothetical protein
MTTFLLVFNLTSLPADLLPSKSQAEGEEFVRLQWVSCSIELLLQ